MNAQEWNALYPVGTPVVAYPGVRPEDPLAVAVRERQAAGGYVDKGGVELCKRLETVTRSVAWALGDGEPVVMVEGYAGGIALTHVDPVCGARFNEAVCRLPKGHAGPHLSPDRPIEPATTPATAYEWGDDDQIGRTVDYSRPAEGRAA